MKLLATVVDTITKHVDAYTVPILAVELPSHDDDLAAWPPMASGRMSEYVQHGKRVFGDKPMEHTEVYDMR